MIAAALFTVVLIVVLTRIGDALRARPLSLVDSAEALGRRRSR